MSIFTQLEPSITSAAEQEQLKRELVITKQKLAMAQTQIALLKHRRPKAIPDGDLDEGYWCGECGETVQDYWSFCPRCGTEITWHLDNAQDVDAFDRRFDR